MQPFLSHKFIWKSIKSQSRSCEMFSWHLLPRRCVKAVCSFPLDICSVAHGDGVSNRTMLDREPPFARGWNQADTNWDNSCGKFLKKKSTVIFFKHRLFAAYQRSTRGNRITRLDSGCSVLCAFADISLSEHVIFQTTRGQFIAPQVAATSWTSFL